MTLHKNGRVIKAQIPADVGIELDKLKQHLGVSTLSNVISLAIRRLAIAELSNRQYQNQTTSLDEKEVA